MKVKIDDFCTTEWNLKTADADAKAWMISVCLGGIWSEHGFECLFYRN